MADKPKRTRKPNWSYEETVCLLQLYREHAHVIRNNFNENGCTFHKKQEAWTKIMAGLQEAFPAGRRSIVECQKRWHTVLQSARPKLAQNRKDFSSTGKSNCMVFLLHGPSVNYLFFLASSLCLHACLFHLSSNQSQILSAFTKKFSNPFTPKHYYFSGKKPQ